MRSCTSPLPCSFDPESGEEVTHLGNVVARGSSVDLIAAEFGIDNTTLLQWNGISDPTKLKAGQILDVPLRRREAMHTEADVVPQAPAHIQPTTGITARGISNGIDVADEATPSRRWRSSDKADEIMPDQRQ